MEFRKTEILPAIDMRMGMVVRLTQGNYDKMTVYNDSPESMAYTFGDAGANWVHLVDLDAARSGEAEREKIGEIISNISGAGLKVEIGGGIRSEKVIREYFLCGADRVVLGTIAMKDPDFAADMIERYGRGIAIGIDIKDGYAAIHGWEELSQYKMDDAFRMFGEMGAETIICTDVSKDGALKGIDERFYEDLVYRYTGQYGTGIIASGGVTDLEDIRRLSSLGLEGIIIGKAIYDGRIVLSDALEICRSATVWGRCLNDNKENNPMP